LLHAPFQAQWKTEKIHKWAYKVHFELVLLHALKCVFFPSISKYEVLKEIIGNLSENDVVKTPELIISKTASMACKAAVKGNDRLSFEEAKKLIDDLFELENPYSCPHGRPTIIEMTKQELEKKFKRIV